MSLQWEDELTKALSNINRKATGLAQDLKHGARVVLADAKERVPKESGYLASTGRIKSNRGGVNTVAITFAGPYARYIHEHLFFKHPTGGQAKYLEDALLIKGKDAINEAGEHFWRRIT